MKNLSLLFVAFVFTAISYGQAVIFEDNFDSYIPGRQLACTNPDWNTRLLNPCGPDDAYILDLYAFSGSNSLVIVDGDGIVKLYGDLTSGKYSVSFMVYIPTLKMGRFSTLSRFTGQYRFAMEVELYAGTGTLHADGINAVAFSYENNTWQSVKIIADLDNDIGEFWFEGAMVYTWQWTLDIFGVSAPLQLSASLFEGWTIDEKDDEMYIDDFLCTNLLPVSVENEEILIEYALHQNYPNPFNPTTTIKYQIPESRFVTLKIFNLLGEELITLVSEVKPIGNYEVKFDGTGLPSGIYFYRLQVYPANGRAGSPLANSGQSYIKTKKMVLMK